jgi:hypothetical protein
VKLSFKRCSSALVYKEHMVSTLRKYPRPDRATLRAGPYMRAEIHSKIEEEKP